MVKCVKEVVTLAIKPAGHAVDIQKAKRLVVFKKATEGVNDEIISAPEAPEVADISQQSVGDLFGKPSCAGLVQQHISREHSCRKKATYTIDIDTEDDDTVAVFCAEHAKHIPGVYLTKGPL